VIAFVSVLCGSASCAEMAAFGRAKESFFRGFLKLKHAIPSHDTFSEVFRMIDPKALDAAFGMVLAEITALLRDGDVIAIDGKALATVPADNGTELNAALEALGLIALRGKVVTADALHCNRRTVAAINAKGGDWCLALKANQDSLLSDARSCFGKMKEGHPITNSPASRLSAGSRQPARSMAR